MCAANAGVNAAANAASTLSPDTQEVRLATTMTGGVSLAIWMGGVWPASSTCCCRRRAGVKWKRRHWSRHHRFASTGSSSN